MSVDRVRFLLSVRCAFIDKGRSVYDIGHVVEEDGRVVLGDVVALSPGMRKGEVVYGESDAVDGEMDGHVAVTDCVLFQVSVLPGDLPAVEHLRDVLDPQKESARWAAGARKTRAGGEVWVTLTACYDAVFAEWTPPESPTERDCGAEFVGWVDWGKVIDYAGAIADARR